MMQHIDPTYRGEAKKDLNRFIVSSKQRPKSLFGRG